VPEIITVNRYVGKQLPSHQFVKLIKENFAEQSARNKIWREDYYGETAYQSAILASEYHLNGKRKISEFEYFSGPYDCVGVQYTIRTSEMMSENAAVNKIAAFF